jgi:hypothetical protein
MSLHKKIIYNLGMHLIYFILLLVVNTLAFYLIYFGIRGIRDKELNRDFFKVFFGPIIGKYIDASRISPISKKTAVFLGYINLLFGILVIIFSLIGVFNMLK